MKTILIIAGAGAAAFVGYKLYQRHKAGDRGPTAVLDTMPAIGQSVPSSGQALAQKTGRSIMILGSRVAL